MILFLSLVIAVVFGSGAFLILQRDLFRVVVGIVLISNAANLFIISAGLTRGEPPIYPLPEGPVADPLVQAMALTAIVISSSVAALLLSLVYRLYLAHDSVDIEDVSAAEMREAEALERGDDPEKEEEPKESPADVELGEDTR
ncbi:Na+/H+ antiporter subunit C [Rubrobacter tropicus]|uniref:Na+/H+ antiporter subunit C n=1 Tax=Rubrobacter tropicus TaxID=2653851 RepID=A0A6G8QCU4_9ACTN|nr:NADH-quinone oxidoreductase subunit K [Rubrobacter tropicus]QIN84258.1 Na+/H+ antiporter subunit C [Rubrobacter tropicus]